MVSNRFIFVAKIEKNIEISKFFCLFLYGKSYFERKVLQLETCCPIK